MKEFGCDKTFQLNKVYHLEECAQHMIVLKIPIEMHNREIQFSSIS